LGGGALVRVAVAGARGGVGRGPRLALWQAASAGDELPLQTAEAAPDFAPLTAFETVLWDYRAGGVSARGHPLGTLRRELRAQGLPDARTVAAMPHGRRVRYAGLVICRQRPGTAAGVTFLTLEDETGFVNAVVWSRVFERFPVLVKTAPFRGVTGRLQVEDGVLHLVADELWEPRVRTAPATAGSRDFH
ncbi:MAG: OB-fold nucleic acid binding domain-containing protein, partial [Deferrisomatales bacterium]